MREKVKKEIIFRAGTAAFAVCASLLAAVLTGCSHNTVSYGDGIMLETTLNPEAYAFGISFRYGKILTACLRENAELEMQGAGSGNAGTDGKTAGAQSSGSVKVKVGPQITGYYVDALKAGAKPEEMVKYTSRE